jgi:dTDP-4-dehydrorhamnose reductase
MDITDPESITKALGEIKPWAVINTAGYVKADQAENEPDRCYLENHFGAVQLASTCRDFGFGYLTFSSDLVFNGQKGSPYLESDPVNPVSVYGASKAMAEKDVLALLPSALVIRTSAFFGPWDEYNFATIALRKLSAGESFEAAAHVRISPTYVVDLVHSCLDLLLDGAQGIWHLANRGNVSWAEFARIVALKAELPSEQIERWYNRQQQNHPQNPIHNTVLESSKAWLMPPLEYAIDRYLREADLLRKLSEVKETQVV